MHLNKIFGRPAFLMEAAGGTSGGTSGGNGGSGATGGGATGAGGSGGGGTGGAPTEGAGGATWLSTFPADLKGYVELKGFKDPAALASSYKELEKAIGIPKEKLVRLPDKEDDPAWGDVYSKLGRPEKPENYEVKVPPGVSDDFAKWAQAQFHGLGLSKRQGEALAAKWMERVTEQATKAQGDAQVAEGEQIKKLKQEWGAAADQNGRIVDSFVAAIGMKPEEQTKLEGALGVDGFSKLMHGIVQKFGIKLGEDTFHGNTGAGNTFGILSPSQAKARIQELQNDPEWTKKYTSGGEKENKEFTQLFEWAYPTEAEERVFT